MKLLLVEDDEVDRMAFERFVRQRELPFDYFVAESVAEAKAYLEAIDFDVILLDHNLGDGTAFDVLEAGPDAPVIIITGTNQIDIAVAAMKAGAFDYLVKDQERNYLHMLPLAVDGAIRRREDEEKFMVLSHAIMSTSDSIFITDLDDNVTFINEAVTTTYGYTEGEIIGEKLSVVGEVGGEGEFDHRRKDGSEFPVSLSRSVVEDDRGNAIAFVIAARDITESKRTEEELRRTNEELKGFSHTVSHDLKGPLAAIMLATSTLVELVKSSGAVDNLKEIDQSIRVIDNNIWKSTALIDDLLALAESGQKPTDVEVVDVSEVVQRVLLESKGSLDERGARVEVDPDLGGFRASPAHVYQLFANLINNSVRHCGVERPLIEVRKLEGEGMGSHRYLVRDNGVGIPPEDLKRIFDPFYKGSSGGTGIGLSTVERIVTLYSGAIVARNDGGACFDFTVFDYEG